MPIGVKSAEITVLLVIIRNTRYPEDHRVARIRTNCPAIAGTARQSHSSGQSTGPGCTPIGDSSATWNTSGGSSISVVNPRPPAGRNPQAARKSPGPIATTQSKFIFRARSRPIRTERRAQPAALVVGKNPDRTKRQRFGVARGHPRKHCVGNELLLLLNDQRKPGREPFARDECARRDPLRKRRQTPPRGSLRFPARRRAVLVGQSPSRRG